MRKAWIRLSIRSSNKNSRRLCGVSLIAASCHNHSTFSSRLRTWAVISKREILLARNHIKFSTLNISIMLTYSKAILSIAIEKIFISWNIYYLGNIYFMYLTQFLRVKCDFSTRSIVRRRYCIRRVSRQEIQRIKRNLRIANGEEFCRKY